MRYFLMKLILLGLPFFFAGSVTAQTGPSASLAGEWLVNANGYTFLMRLSGDPRFSGTLAGLNNSDSVTQIDGQRGGGIAQFTRTNDENESFQTYRGQVVVTEEGKWIFGSFRWQGGDYSWCAVTASLVDPAKRKRWTNCKIGWETGETGVAQ